MAIIFEKYYRPETIEECISLLQQYGDDAKIMAGGTDVVIKMKNNGLTAKAIVDITKVKDLYTVEVKEESVFIGAAVDLVSISKAEELAGEWDIIRQCAGHVSSWQIRNKATMGGNVCNASPSADTVPALIISNAVVNIVGPDGKRDVNIDEFFLAPGKTVLKNAEIVVGFTVPRQGERCGAVYHKHAMRGDTDISIIGVGVRLQLSDDKKILKARIALAAVAPTPLRAKAVEDYLTGKELTEELAIEAGKQAADLVKPISDQRASKEYRKEMIFVNVKNMLMEAAKQVV